MATATQLVQAALSEVGYTENPRGSNRTKFAAEAGHTNGVYWCATFTVAMMRRVRMPIPPGADTASTRANLAAWKRAGRFIAPRDLLPGDITFYHITGRNGPGQPDHTGICVVAPRNGVLEAVEGNTSSGPGGSQDNGGGVFRRSRSLAVVLGGGRPNFAAALPPSVPWEDDDIMKLLHVTDGPDKDSVWLQRGKQLLLMRPPGYQGAKDDVQQAKNAGAPVGDMQEPLWGYLKKNSEVVLP